MRYSPHPIKSNSTKRGKLVQEAIYQALYDFSFSENINIERNIEINREKPILRNYLLKVYTNARSTLGPLLANNSSHEGIMSKIGLSNSIYSAYCDIFWRYHFEICVFEIKDRVWNFNIANIGDIAQISVFYHLFKEVTSLEPKLFVYYVPNNVLHNVNPLTFNLIERITGNWRHANNFSICQLCPLKDNCSG